MYGYVNTCYTCVYVCIYMYIHIFLFPFPTKDVLSTSCRVCSRIVPGASVRM